MLISKINVEHLNHKSPTASHTWLKPPILSKIVLAAILAFANSPWILSFASLAVSSLSSFCFLLISFWVSFRSFRLMQLAWEIDQNMQTYVLLRFLKASARYLASTPLAMRIAIYNNMKSQVRVVSPQHIKVVYQDSFSHWHNQTERCKCK